jgi:alginate O-acetyltransferase complex protein AlgI
MPFNSGIFLFCFFPAFLLVYFGSPQRWRNMLLLCASVLFYAWGEPRFIFWVLGSALLDYRLGLAIASSRLTHERKVLVGIGVCANLALLGWFKYAPFAADVVSPMLERLGSRPFSLAAIALPIGISFIAFEKITYLVDIYRGSGTPARNLGTYLLYVFYFPKLLAGPIIRYCDIQDQLSHRTVSFEDFRAGLVRVVVGLGKKVLIADHVGHYADQVFACNPARLICTEGWLGVAAFTLQIYFDFSGYSDVAIGISRALGFRLNENFNNPYLATSFTDFWRRWHISLTTWIRNYVYIPLGGNRCSTPRSYANLCICFLLSGLWHGAAWTFVLWGIFHGTFLVLDRAFWLEWQQRMPVVINRALTLLLVMIGWVIFRARNMESMDSMFSVLFSPWRAAEANVMWFSPDIAFAMFAGIFLVYLPLARIRPAAPSMPRWRACEVAASVALLLLVIGRLAVTSYTAFLYFRF